MLRPVLASVALALLLVLPAPASAVFHGTPVPAAETPWLVSFVARDVVCGGTLVAPDRVLTAAHCVQGVDPARVRVRIGGGTLGATRVVGWKGAVLPETYRAVPSPVHPEDPRAAGAVDDLALVVLERPVAGVPVAPVVAAPPAEGEATLTVGRGRTGPVPRVDTQVGDPATPPADTGRPSHVALGAAQVVEGRAACAAAYGTLLFPAHHLCTVDRGPATAQACAGDSGSPVLVRRDGVLQVAGVVSWGGETKGRDCGEGLPDVAQRVVAQTALLRRAAVDVVSPWAERRVRVRRVAGGRIRCVVGAWGGGEATFRVQWWREGKPGKELDPGTGAIRIVPGRRVAVAGTTSTRADRPGVQLGCTVRATSAGGWAQESSYNAL